MKERPTEVGQLQVSAKSANPRCVGLAMRRNSTRDEGNGIAHREFATSAGWHGRHRASKQGVVDCCQTSKQVLHMCQVTSSFTCAFLAGDSTGRVETASLAKAFVPQLPEDSVSVDNVVKVLEAIADLMDQRQRVREVAGGCEDDGQDVVDKKLFDHCDTIQCYNSEVLSTSAAYTDNSSPFSSDTFLCAEEHMWNRWSRMGCIIAASLESASCLCARRRFWSSPPI